MSHTETKPFETLVEKATSYCETTLELFKLNAIDKTSSILSSLVVYVFILVIGFFLLLSINIGISLWLGEMLGKSYYGFFAMAGINIIVISIIYACRKQCIKQPIRSNIIRQMLYKKNV
ncbi:MAG: hypothetical protein NTZ59_10130 [Bacteroidetes bacterium]|nr:hypothetical protein [Bacteroidota bacterium]